MDTTVTLDEQHFTAVAERARELGTTPEGYLHSLIDSAGKGFDKILEPVRKGFESMSDDDLESLFERANKAARQRK